MENSFLEFRNLDLDFRGKARGTAPFLCRTLQGLPFRHVHSLTKEFKLFLSFKHKMENHYFSDKTFDKINFTENPLPKGEYERCTFANCYFSNSDISGIKFLECGFTSCNLSMAKLVKTAFSDVKFKDCKMLGLQFENCNEFGFAVHFDGCMLYHSSFYKRKMKKTTFKNSQLHEVDFAECDLSGSIFDNCDLIGAKFENTILEKADFRTSYNYSINPEMNRIKKAKFSLIGITGLLDKYDIEIDPKD